MTGSVNRAGVPVPRARPAVMTAPGRSPCSHRSAERKSNRCATSDAPSSWRLLRSGFLLFLSLALGPADALAQQPDTTPLQSATSKGKAGASLGPFLAGAAIGLATHEAGHLLFDIVFDAGAGVRKVDFHGIPFFAITHRSGLSPRREFVISSAGFWMQHAGSEWLLTRRPRLRVEFAPLSKGLLAFDIGASIAYSGAAFARTGPVERDTRGMAESARIDERWIGALILAPALLDSWRYFHPDARWATWASRGIKIGMVVMVAR